MLRSHLLSSAVAAGLLAFAPDTGAGSAVASAPGETVTPAAATAATPAKRGRGATGANVSKVETLAVALEQAKAKGNKFSAFTVKVNGKPDRFYVSNHRTAVAGALFREDGIAILTGDGTHKGGRSADPAKRAEEADKMIESLDEKTRAELFAKYIKTNPALAASLPAASAPRADTTPAAEFDSAGKANTAAAKAGTSAKGKGTPAVAGKR